MEPAIPERASSHTEVTFYFDLVSPYAYLTAARLHRSGVRVTWWPVLLVALFAPRGRGPWVFTEERDTRIAEVESRAACYGLPRIRWPEGWPPDNTLSSMRACVWAAALGALEPFAMACYRSEFVDGHSLGELATLQAVAARVGLPASELPAAVAGDAIKAELKRLTGLALDAGVTGVPTVAVDGRLFYGDDRLAQAIDLGRAGPR